MLPYQPMNPSESSIIHFIRGVTLLTILVAVPGVAIFWNHLPKYVVREPVITRTSPQETTPSPPQEGNNTSFSPTGGSYAATQNDSVAMHASPIQQVSWEHPQAPVQEIALLRQRLIALGATNLDIRLLGNQGGLYSFSCHVPFPGTSSSKRLFQATGTDPIAIKQSVIADIERWKNGH